MKERPILFNAEMVRAVLDGRKTQTRRIVKQQPIGEDNTIREIYAKRMPAAHPCPFGQQGDRLWVRETHSIRIKPEESTDGIGRVWYYATSEDQGITKWKPSIHMPRWASRILLEITRVRVERLQDISEEDAIAEGSFLGQCQCWPKPRNPIESLMRQTGCHIHGTEFKYLWESINGPGSWDANPWVWVIEFKKIA